MTAATKVAPAVITEVLSLRAAKSHTRRCQNSYKRQTQRAGIAAAVFEAAIAKGDSSVMTQNSLNAARHQQAFALRLFDSLESDIAKLDAQIAVLIEEGTRIEARRAAEKEAAL
jgi:hypothetical protein